MKLRPLHAAIVIVLFAASVLVADYALDGGFKRGYQRVSPDPQGRVILDVSDLPTNEVRFYRFLNAGNQEVKFFVGRDTEDHIQVAFDANMICYKTGRGYSSQDGWVACNKCDKSFRLTGVNEGGGGCKPVPFDFELQGEQLVLAENDILTGWRYFR